MKISEFATQLVESLTRKTLPPDLRDEQDFKRRFVIPAAARIDAHQEDVLLFSPPFLNEKCCSSPCREDPPGGPGRVVGCPECWAAMKAWGSVAAFGTHHTFDLVAKDRSQTLAVEVKLVAVKGGRMPNPEIQRFLGQCSLAATNHDIVIGVCGVRGDLNPRWRREPDDVVKWFKARNVHLVVRPIQ